LEQVNILSASIGIKIILVRGGKAKSEVDLTDASYQIRRWAGIRGHFGWVQNRGAKGRPPAVNPTVIGEYAMRMHFKSGFRQFQYGSPFIYGTSLRHVTKTVARSRAQVFTENYSGLKALTYSGLREKTLIWLL
jgi:hypothetical protein